MIWLMQAGGGGSVAGASTPALAQITERALPRGGSSISWTQPTGGEWSFGLVGTRVPRHTCGFFRPNPPGAAAPVRPSSVPAGGRGAAALHTSILLPPPKGGA